MTPAVPNFTCCLLLITKRCSKHFLTWLSKRLGTYSTGTQMPLMRTASTLAVTSDAHRQNEGMTSRTASIRQVEITTTQYR